MINVIFINDQTCSAAAPPLFQYDYGQSWQIEGLELPQTFEVDFATIDSSASVTAIGENDIVQVPDDLLDLGIDIVGYIYLHSDETDGYTEYVIRQPVISRQSRTDEQPTPQEQTLIEQAIVVLNHAVEQTGQDVEAAQQAADDAEAAASSASTSAQTASTAATQADASATAAAISAGAAETSATQAGLSAASAATYANAAAISAQTAQEAVASIGDSVTRAESAASTATSAASTATTKAAEANTSAGTAAQNATTATVKAQEAAQSATQAAQSATAAQTAQTAAETAQTGAQTAQTAAESAAAEAEVEANRAETYADRLINVYPTDTASGAIASFSDGADGMPLKSLVIDIDPVQDLHGYDNPWPAGGGINIADISDVSIPTGQDNYATLVSNMTLPAGDYTLSWTLSANVTATRNRPYHCKAGTSQEIVYMDGDDKTAGRGSWTFTLAEEKTLDIRWWFHTVSPACTISNIMLEKGSTAHDYQPYSNICPISGWDAVTVVRTGKNLLGHDGENLPFSQHGVTVTRTGSEYTVTVESSSSGYPYALIGVLHGIKAGTYYLSVNGIPSTIPNNNFGVRLVNRSVSPAVLYVATMNGVRFTVSNDVKDIVNIELFITPANVPVGTYTITAQLELGSTASSYEPYAGQVIPITWSDEAGTVYKGTVDVTGGVLKVNKALFDCNDISGWTRSSSYPGSFFRQRGGLVYHGVQVKASTPFICSHAKTVTDLNNYLFGCCFMDNAVNIRIMDENATLTDWTTYLAQQTAAGTPVLICCELETPVEYTLTPEQVVSLLGQNNIWADCGDTSVEYRADIQLYLDKKLAALAAALS